MEPKSILSDRVIRALYLLLSYFPDCDIFCADGR